MKVLNANPIKQARARMKNSFENDPDFEWTYICNIAMLLHDRYGGAFLDYNTRNEAAKAILKLLFWD
jgi:hypothetical protein